MAKFLGTIEGIPVYDDLKVTKSNIGVGGSGATQIVSGGKTYDMDSSQLQQLQIQGSQIPGVQDVTSNLYLQAKNAPSDETGLYSAASSRIATGIDTTAKSTITDQSNNPAYIGSTAAKSLASQTATVKPTVTPQTSGITTNGVSSMSQTSPAETTLTKYYNDQKALNPNISFPQIQQDYVNKYPTSSDSSPLIAKGIKPTTQTAIQAVATATPSSTSENSTFLSAQKAGFTGKYADWVSAGRPNGGTTPNASPNNPSPTDTTDNARSDQLKQAHDIVNANAGLDQGTKDLFNSVIDSWDMSQSANATSILDAFNKIKTSTIDPYYKEKADVYAKDIQSQLSDLSAGRALELQNEAQTLGANGENVRNEQNKLESNGLTFSGEGIRQLGSQAAITPFGGAPTEGLVTQGDKLLSSSSALRYQNQLNSIGRQAEQQLGSSNVNIAGYTPTLGVDATGTNYGNQQGAYAKTISDLSKQYEQNSQYSKPVDVYNS